MATVDSDARVPDEPTQSSSENTALDAVADAVAGILLEHANTESVRSDKTPVIPLRPLRVYKRYDILLLSKSPLVKPPNGLPALKDWFGDWNEQQTSNKKESEASSPSNNPRERRFRRDPEDADASTRPSFRSTLSQPSQMGNFRHQSIRTNDRDKDKDTDRERERERDLRDKEGQERLRNLSDKYDRERLGISSSSALRHKERDSAPHLASATSSRLGSAQTPSPTTRRTEGRDVPKRKTGESSEDWRRGPETARTARDDRSDNSRRDRDGRERPRSRVRDSSRPRRDLSNSRRDRDRDRDEKDRDRDRVRDRRGDADRDEHRKDKDDYPRRDRDEHGRRDWDDPLQRDSRDRHDYSRSARDVDRDRDLDEDPRRWRDDGKRDERIAARRDRDRPWEKHDERDRERPSDDRDTRPRRANGRDRRAGVEDGKERDDRREREAEPAWMETYVPTTPVGGILGAKTGDGELDGIQAWKKGMKDKERKERGTDSSQDATKPKPAETSASSATPPSTAPLASEDPLDEIQIFKLMMKREAEKKDVEPQVGGTIPPADVGDSHGWYTPPGTNGQPGWATPVVHGWITPPTLDESKAASMSREHVKGISENPSPVAVRPADSLASLQIPVDDSFKSQVPVTADADNRLQSERSKAGPSLNGSQTNSAKWTAVVPGDLSLPQRLPTPTLDIPQERSRVMSRIPSNGPSSAMSSVTHSLDASPIDHSAISSSGSSAFNPPPGSRLLAFGSRLPSSGSDIPPSKSHHSSDSLLNQFPPPGVPSMPPHRSSNNNSSMFAANHHMGGMHQVAEPMSGPGHDAQFSSATRLTPSDSSRVRSFSPHRNISQSYQYEDMHDASMGQMSDPLRRSSIASAVERAAFGLSSEPGTPYTDLGGGTPGANYAAGSFDLNGGNANYATGKGSRLAKLLDSKMRDVQGSVGVRKGPPGLGYVSTSPHPGQRQDPLAHNGMMGNADTRTMEDIFAMLQSSANHRHSPQIPQTGRIPSGGNQFNPELHVLQQQQHQQLHAPQLFQQNSHLEALYDSRLDDRNFMPDGMVPGLRPVPPRSRSREPSGVLFNEQIDDPLHFNVQRIPQQRNLEHMYSGPAPAVYAQQAAMMRNGGIPLQQAQFRGGPSPIANLPGPQGPAQRLPPGLANLGGRPPHDPSQFLGGPVGVLGGSVHGGMHGGAPAQSFNNFNGGGLGYGGNAPLRGPPGPQNPLTLNQMANLQSTMDMRAANQAQLLAMGGGGGLNGGLRGGGLGYGPQHGPASQMPPAHMMLRQQQQQQQQQHIPPHMLPPHLQPQGLGGGNGQVTQDLMALLMGGHRD